jgi:hypothetical protein
MVAHVPQGHRVLLTHDRITVPIACPMNDLRAPRCPRLLGGKMAAGLPRKRLVSQERSE